MPARTLGPKGEWIVRSHVGWRRNELFFIRVWKPQIDWRGERVPARMLGPERGWIVRSHFFIRMGKPLPSRRVLKP